VISETLVQLLRDRIHLLLCVPFAGPFSICVATGGQRQADEDVERPQEREVLLLRAQATRHGRRRSVVVQIGTLNEGALHA